MTSVLQATTLSPSLGNIRTDMGLVNSIRDLDPENFRFVTMPVLTADFDANRLLPKEPQSRELWDSLMDGTQLPAGTVYMDLDGNYFTVEEGGLVVPGGDPRTDDEIGSIDWNSVN